MTLGALAKLSLCDRCDVRHSLTPWWKASCLLSAHKPQPLLSATHMLPHGPGSIPSARPLCPPSSWTDPSCPSVSYTGHLNTWLCSPWGPWRYRFLYENAAQLIPSVTSELTDEVPSSLEGCSACLDQVTGHPTPPNPTRTCFYCKVSHVSTGAGNNTAVEEWVPSSSVEASRQLQEQSPCPSCAAKEHTASTPASHSWGWPGSQWGPSAPCPRAPLADMLPLPGTQGPLSFPGCKLIALCC